MNKAIKKYPSTISIIMNRIKEKIKMPIDLNNINRVSMKEISVDRKNLNIKDTP